MNIKGKSLDEVLDIALDLAEAQRPDIERSLVTKWLLRDVDVEIIDEVIEESRDAWPGERQRLRAELAQQIAPYYT